MWQEEEIRFIAEAILEYNMFGKLRSETIETLKNIVKGD